MVLSRQEKTQYIMDIKKFKPTFASVLSILGIIAGIPFGIYCLTLAGRASLGGVLVFGVVIGLVVLLAIDRILVSFLNPKRLSIIEFGICVLCLLLYFAIED